MGPTAATARSHVTTSATAAAATPCRISDFVGVLSFSRCCPLSSPPPPPPLMCCCHRRPVPFSCRHHAACAPHTPCRRCPRTRPAAGAPARAPPLTPTHASCCLAQSCVPCNPAPACAPYRPMPVRVPCRPALCRPMPCRPMPCRPMPCCLAPYHVDFYFENLTLNFEFGYDFLNFSFTF